jgi:phasin family protein
MSQKPKPGAQARATSTPKVAAKTAQFDARSVVESEPVAEPEPAAAAEPVMETEAAVTAMPEAVDTVPVSEPDAMMEPLDTAMEPIVAAVEAIPEPMMATPETITADPITPDPITTNSVEAIEPAAAITQTKPTLTQGMKSMMKTTEDLVAFGQANLEAFVKSGQIWSAGVQELTKQMATTAKASFEESVSTFKAITTAKSVKEAMELQSTFAKSALEKAMAESNKLTDASIKLTEQTLAPITARVTVAVETFGKAA